MTASDPGVLNESLLRRRRHGVIEVAAGQVVAIRPRWFPKRISQVEVWTWQAWQRQRQVGDHCRLYYNQPLRIPDFLAVPFIVASKHATFATVRRAVMTLDEIARIKGADAILCHVSNRRLSDRVLRRWGYEPHAKGQAGRHFIKRLRAQESVWS